MRKVAYHKHGVYGRAQTPRLSQGGVLGVCGTELWEAAGVFTPLFITGANLQVAHSRSGTSCQGYCCLSPSPAASRREEGEGRRAICGDGLLTSLDAARLQEKHSLPSTLYISVCLSYS